MVLTYIREKAGAVLPAKAAAQSGQGQGEHQGMAPLQTR